KFNYINISLFSLSLNILSLSSEIYNKRNHILTFHKATTTSRMLCECELYAPANYDNDPQMKEIIDNFNKQTQQRFHEYDDRMVEKRKRCKDKCDKEIQKIILKDKLEKELMDKFATLGTDIQSDAIPTCVCEKSMADKMAKGCFRCGGILGTAAPELGAMGATALYTLNQLKPEAIATAIASALKANADKISAVAKAAGDVAGKNAVIVQLKRWGMKEFCPELLESIGATKPYTDTPYITQMILAKHDGICGSSATNDVLMCKEFGIKLGIKNVNGQLTAGQPNQAIPKMINGLV
ncbi:rifin, partial [Plasmodium reichenowi]